MLVYYPAKFDYYREMLVARPSSVDVIIPTRWDQCMLVYHSAKSGYFRAYRSGDRSTYSSHVTYL